MVSLVDKVASFMMLVAEAVLLVLVLFLVVIVRSFDESAALRVCDWNRRGRRYIWCDFRCKSCLCWFVGLVLCWLQEVAPPYVALSGLKWEGKTKELVERIQ